ncbi:MAG: ubiquinone biosynthesis regulatory protein kinase UbiB [Gammaproteobacteria bacterium]
MKTPKQLLRLFYINYVIYRRGLDQLVWTSPRWQMLRLFSYLNPWNWWRREVARGLSIRLALEDLGPIFIKFGQILSTRPDLIPEDILVELQKLQDQVPPFPSSEAVQMLEKNYGRPLSQVFAEFDQQPLASASIAQVHAATLVNGKKVVVKIQRPHIAKIIQRDVGLLYTIAHLAEKFWSRGKHLRAVELVKELDLTLRDELDFMFEAANASQLRRNFSHSPILYIPEIQWDYCSSTVLVMERIKGIPVSDKIALQAAHVDLKRLAERGVEIFFTQVFRDGFFHADMHPGNIFVSPDEPQNPHYIAVDFGIVGTLSPKDRHYLEENILAFFRRNYRRVALLHIESGWVPPDTRVELFESAIRTVCEPVFERPLQDISFAQLLSRLFQVASRFKMEVQPQLFLLQKTLFNIEGLGRKLYPQLDLWATAKPLLERNIRQRYKLKATLKQAHEKAPYVLKDLAMLPGLWADSLQQQKQQNLQAVWQQKNLPNRKMHSTGFLRGLGLGCLVLAAVSYFILPSVTPLWYGITVGVGALSMLLATRGYSDT